MIVVNRFLVPAADVAAVDAFVAAARSALDALAGRPGHVSGTIGRNVDDPDLWLITTTWANVGSYRRALSSYDVKLHAVPLLSSAIDEPSAYEVLASDGGVGDGGEARFTQGDASALNRVVPRQLD